MILNQALRVLNEFREGKTRQFRSLTYQIETGPNNKEQLSSYDEIIINQNIDLMKSNKYKQNNLLNHTFQPLQFSHFLN